MRGYLGKQRWKLKPLSGIIFYFSFLASNLVSLWFLFRTFVTECKLRGSCVALQEKLQISLKLKHKKSRVTLSIVPVFFIVWFLTSSQNQIERFSFQMCGGCRIFREWTCEGPVWWKLSQKNKRIFSYRLSRVPNFIDNVDISSNRYMYNFSKSNECDNVSIVSKRVAFYIIPWSTVGIIGQLDVSCLNDPLP